MPTKIAEVIFIKIEKLFLTFTQKCKSIVKQQNSKNNFEKTNKIGEVILPGFMTFYKCYSNQDNVE